MYHGHFATALFIHALFPFAPSAVFYGSVLLDLIDGVNVAIGINKVTPDMSAGPYLPMRLDFIDWDHSLVMALVWSFVFALFYVRRSVGQALLAFVSVFSHWLDDWPVHNNDLALYPHSKEHFGYSLWTKLSPYGSWGFEVGFCVVFCAAAAWLNARRGVHSYGPHVLIIILALSMTPHTALPVYVIPHLSSNAARFLGGPLVTIGMLVPAWLMTNMAKTTEKNAKIQRAQKAR